MVNQVRYKVIVEDGFTKPLNDFSNKTDGLDRKMAGLGGSLKGILGPAALAAAATGVAALGKEIIGLAADAENAQTAFKVMLGGGEEGALRASKMVAALRKEAASTPFEFGDLADSTKTMLNFGIEANKVIPIMRMLGDVSMGDKNKLQGLTLAFSQVQSTGRLMGQDLLQMINAGFNPLQVISQKTGKSMGELKKEMEKGAISADMVTQAFIDATSEGGLFYKGMEEGSKTLTGQWSTFIDQIKEIGINIGDKMLDPLKKVLQTTSEIVKWIVLNKDGLLNMFRPLWENVLPILEEVKSIFNDIFGGDKNENTINFLKAIATLIKMVSYLLKPFMKMTLFIYKVIGLIIGLAMKLIGLLAKWGIVKGFDEVKEGPKAEEPNEFSTTKESLGITDAYAPLAEMTKAAKANKSKATSQKTAANVNSIVGASPKVININIGALINENKNVIESATGINDLKQFEKRLIDVLTRVVNDAQIAIG